MGALVVDGNGEITPRSAQLWASLLAQLVILTVIPPGPTAANQTALNGMPSQPDLPRTNWTGLSARLAVITAAGKWCDDAISLLHG
jgi:hypothetical protein